MKGISCWCAFKSFAFVIYLSNGHWSRDVFLQLTIVISVVYLRYTMERVLCMYLDWFGMHFPKSKMVSYRSVMGTGHTVQLLCDTEVSKAFITEYIY